MSDDWITVKNKKHSKKSTQNIDENFTGYRKNINNSFQDHKVIILNKSKPRKELPIKESVQEPPKLSKNFIENAKRKGLVESVKKVDSYNSSSVPNINPRKIENLIDDPEQDFHQRHITSKTSLRIQKARTSLGMTQKDLALKINEKVNIVNDYETGKAIPDITVTQKLEKALGIKIIIK